MKIFRTAFPHASGFSRQRLRLTARRRGRELRGTGLGRCGRVSRPLSWVVRRQRGTVAASVLGSDIGLLDIGLLEGRPAMARLVITSAGTLGDYLPFVHLGKELRARG